VLRCVAYDLSDREPAQVAVGPEGRSHVEHVRRRRHVGDVEFGELLDVVEHGRKVAAHALELRVIEFEPRQRGEPAYGVCGDLHGRQP